MYSLWFGMVLLGLLDTLSVFSVNVYSVSSFAVHSVLFCCLAVLDPRLGHTMDALSPFIFVVYSVVWGGMMVGSRIFSSRSREALFQLH